MKKRFYIIAIVCLSSLLSCYSDKGNYDYVEIDQIEVSGIEKSYTKTSFSDVLTITPKVSSDNSNDTFEYLWKIYRSYEFVPNELKIDTIGRESVLNFPVKLKQGYYDLILEVKSQRTGVTKFHQTELRVMTKFSLGFYVLKELNGATEMDLHLNDKSSMPNLIEKSLGAPFLGKPVNLNVLFAYSHVVPSGEFPVDMSLTVCNENDTKIFSTEDMGLIFDQKSLYFGDIPKEKPIFWYQGYYGVSYVAKDGHYYTAQDHDEGYYGPGKFGFPGDVTDGSSVNINTVFCEASLIYYDDKNGRFLVGDWNGGIRKLSGEDENGVMQSNLPYNISHKLLFFGKNHTGKVINGYALFQDATDSEKRYFYKMDISKTSGSFHNPIKSVTTIGSGLKFNKATLFSTNERDARIIYFVTENQLYTYDVDGNKETLLTPTGFGSGEEITFVRNRFWIDESDAENNFNYLVIGTHNAGKYKVYLYKTVGGIPDGAPKRILEGDGKPVMLQFTSPKMTHESINYYPTSN